MCYLLSYRGIWFTHYPDQGKPYILYVQYLHHICTVPQAEEARLPTSQRPKAATYSHLGHHLPPKEREAHLNQTAAPLCNASGAQVY